MRIQIDDVIYPVEESIDGAALGDLIHLKLKTKGKLSDDFLGLDPPWIRATFNNGLLRAREPGFNSADLLGDVEFLYAVVGLIWLARRKAGDFITIEEAGRVAFTEVLMLDDEEPEPEVQEPDPKAPSSGEDAPTGETMQNPPN